MLSCTRTVIGAVLMSSPYLSVIVRLSTKPCFFSSLAMSSIVPVVSFIQVGIE